MKKSIICLIGAVLLISASFNLSAAKAVNPEKGAYVIGTWAWQYWSLKDFQHPNDLNTYNHISYGMLTDLSNLSTGYLDVKKPWNNVGDFLTVKKQYSHPIYGYTLGGQDTTGTVNNSEVISSFDTGTPWAALDVDAEGTADSKEIMSVYDTAATAPAKPKLTSYTFELDDTDGAGFSSIQERIKYLESLDNAPDRYVIMCYWGTQWNAAGGADDWSTGGAWYVKIDPMLEVICSIPNLSSKKVYLALCTQPYGDTQQDPQFEYFCSLISKYDLGGLYIWRSSGYPLTQNTVDILNKQLKLSPALENRDN